MSVPKRRRSKSKQGRHRSQWKLTAPKFNICSNCKEAVLPHTVCMHCGYYGGEKVLEIETKEEKALRKKKEKIKQ
ncbi:MAG: 50S ribosomal protein L32 [candidate division WOR-3 bacterium]